MLSHILNYFRRLFTLKRRYWRRVILLGAFILRLSIPLGMAPAATGSIDIQMTGTITDSSCNVSNASANQSVALGDIQAGTFTAKGSTSSPKPFSIELTGCSDSISGAAVNFTGTADADNSTLIALTNTGTQASGVAVQLLDVANTVIPINSTTTSYFLSPGSNSLQFHLRYKSTSTIVTPGDANAVLYFDMSYQ